MDDEQAALSENALLKAPKKSDAVETVCFCNDRRDGSQILLLV
jgi:hypothetical protein